MDVLSISVGVAGVGVAYFLYRCVTEGLPAAWTWVKAKWNAGAAAAKALQRDVDTAHERITSLEGDVAKLKAYVSLPQANPAPAALPLAKAAAAAAAPPQPVAPTPALQTQVPV